METSFTLVSKNPVGYQPVIEVRPRVQQSKSDGQFLLNGQILRQLLCPQNKSPRQSELESQSPSPIPHGRRGVQHPHKNGGIPLHDPDGIKYNATINLDITTVYSID